MWDASANVLALWWWWRWSNKNLLLCWEGILCASWCMTWSPTWPMSQSGILYQQLKDIQTKMHTSIIAASFWIPTPNGTFNLDFAKEAFVVSSYLVLFYECSLVAVLIARSMDSIVVFKEKWHSHGKMWSTSRLEIHQHRWIYRGILQNALNWKGDLSKHHKSRSRTNQTAVGRVPCFTMTSIWRRHLSIGRHLHSFLLMRTARVRFEQVFLCNFKLDCNRTVYVAPSTTGMYKTRFNFRASPRLVLYGVRVGCDGCVNRSFGVAQPPAQTCHDQRIYELAF